MAGHPEVYFGAGSAQELENVFPNHKFHLLHIPEVSDQRLKQIRSYLSGRIVSQKTYQAGMPDLAMVRQMQNDFWSQDSKIYSDSALLAIGGGSLMDLAKVLRFKPTHPDWLNDHLNLNLSDVATQQLPLILMPTTAGTGSEVTPTATIWDFEHQKKHSFFGSAVFANIAIVDSQLSSGAPWKITRDSALDALSHALEAIWNKNRSDEASQLAILAAKNICLNLPVLQVDLDNQEARERLAEASLAAGLAMAKTQTALVHALSYEDTAATYKSHGESCANWLPYVWQMLIESGCDERVKREVDDAVGGCFSSPQQMRDWLFKLGVDSQDPNNKKEELLNRVLVLKSSPRGGNFLGFSN